MEQKNIEILKIEAGQPYKIDIFRPEDAHGVANCFFAVYGPSYPFPVYFDTDYLVSANKDNEIKLVVARTERGDIVGCGLLYHSSAPNPRVYELGRYVILPDYRNSDIMLDIQNFIGENLIPKLAANQIFGEAVCHQIFYQKFWAMGKFRETALEVGLMPASAYGLEGDRVSTLLQFQSIQKETRELFIPVVYEEAIHFLLDGLDLDRVIAPSDAAVPSHVKTKVISEYFDFAQVARFNILIAGTDFLKTLEGLEIQARDRGVTVYEFFINLEKPWAGRAVDLLREKGYFFGGLLPHWFGGDGLLMQKIEDMPSLEEIKLYSERAHRLLDFIRRDIESNPKCIQMKVEESQTITPENLTRGNALAIDRVKVDGASLTIEQVSAVSRRAVPVHLSEDNEIIERVESSAAFIRWGVKTGEPIYGVNTGFGGMANVTISEEKLNALQNNLIRFLQAGAGGYLPASDVRAAMLVRANSHMRGVSGIRMELIERMVAFLNSNATPMVREMGSIGASGDLVPLATITGALVGADPSFEVSLKGQTLGSTEALARMGLQPITLGPKEGLAMVNGTSVMTGIAANCLYETRQLLAMGMGCHALYIQALQASNQSFHPFIQEVKPHHGQIWSAAQMLKLLQGSRFIRNELDGHHDSQGDQPVQDRYSLRCMPQYLGPIIDGFLEAVQVVETELNSATDNPLIDGGNAISYHTGNFLGQYIGVWMDHLRYYLGLFAKHLDVQIALLVAPEFSAGLTPSLVGNEKRGVNMGLKGLQISANSIMPLLSYYGNSIADRYPTHAEQFNQNINSQGFNSAVLTRKSVDVLRSYIAAALLFGVQAVELRMQRMEKNYDPRRYLSPATLSLYEAVYDALDRLPSSERPLVWDDDEQPMDLYLQLLSDNILAEGSIVESVRGLIIELAQPGR